MFHIHLKLNISKTLFCACPPHLHEGHTHFLGFSSQKSGNDPGNCLPILHPLQISTRSAQRTLRTYCFLNRRLLSGVAATTQVQTTITSSPASYKFSAPLPCLSDRPPIHPYVTFQVLQIKSDLLVKSKALHYLRFANTNFISASSSSH